MPRKKRKFKKRIYVLAGIAVVLIVSLAIFLFMPGGYSNVSQGEIVYTGSFDGVVMRDEVVYTQEDYGKIEMLVLEGEKVAKDTKIAQAYKWDYSDKKTDELIEIENQIYEYQQENVIKDIVNQDLETLTAEINNKTEEISNIMSQESDGDMLTVKNELSALKLRQEELLKTLSNPNDATLNDLYTRRQAILDSIESSKSDVIAQEANIVSFYFDGAEELLNIDNLDNLTQDQLEDILEGNLPSTNNENGQTSIYRMVSPNNWHLIVLAESGGVSEMIVDETYDISFKDVEEGFQGKLISNKKLESKTMYVFEFNQDITPVLSKRTSEIEIKKTFSGLKVDSDVIKEQNGVKGVYVEMPQGKTFLAINTVVTSGNSSIIEFVDTSVSEPVKIYD